MRGHRGTALTPSLEQLDTECIDPTDDGPRNRIQVSKSYFVDGIPKEDNEAHFTAVRQWWTSHGFGVLDDERTPPRRLRVEHSEDGFRMAFQEGGDGSVLLSATSPCRIWPDGTPVPEP
ncbi:MAG: hypothetical protein LC799_34800 [Actinobacteria bacterium]|nr:hypothetical protein [Actinomycetota bacterium]